MFSPQVCLPFLVESKRQELLAHHTSRIVSRQVRTSSSLGCMVFVHVCAGQELQEEIKKLEHEALEKGTAIKIPYLCPKAEKSWNILVSQTWPGRLNPKILFYNDIHVHSDQDFSLVLLLCCEVQELPEEEALGRCGGHLDASMRAAW